MCKDIINKIMALSLSLMVAITIAPAVMLSAASEVHASTGSGSVKVDGVSKNFDAFMSWAEESTGNGNAHNVEMMGDWTLNDTLQFAQGANINFYMNGHKITMTDDESVITVGEYGKNAQTTLNVIGGDDTISHTYNAYKQKDGADTESRTACGALITGGEADNLGGGICIRGKKCGVTVDSVTIAGNEADDHGAGIYCDDESCKITLRNSEISGNYAYNDGGGVYLNDDVTSLILDNSDISYNYAEDDGGGIATCDTAGAEYLTIKGKATENENGEMDLPDVSYNYCGNDYDCGGGIYLGNDNITLTGLDIHHNKSTGDHGGGIYTLEESINISDCLIHDNYAEEDGGGIYVYNDSNTINGCEITKNSCGGDGDGIYVDSNVDNSPLTITGDSIIKENGSRSKDVYVDDSSYLDVSGLIGDADVRIYKEDVDSGTELTNGAGTYNTKYLKCENSGYHFEWSYDTRKVVYKTGDSAEETKKTTVDAGPVKQDGNKEYREGYPLMKGYFTHCDTADSNNDTDSVFYYSDGFFDEEEDAFEYNQHLATTSLDFAMASMYTSNSSYKGKHEAVRQFMSNIGCADENIYVNDFYTEKPGEDSIGVAIGKKSLMKGKAKSGYTLVPITIRSAGYESEWVSNATLGATGEAKGFSSAAEQSFTEVKKYIEKYDLSEDIENGRVVFWVTGFSRGGATANLLSKRIIDKYCGDDGNRIFSYTFATPMGAEHGKNSEKYYCIHNTVNYADLVPLVAPSDMGFQRYGVDHFLPGTEAGDVNENTFDNDGNMIDNDPLRTVGYGYTEQRTLMRKQMPLVDSGIIADDYFCVATLKFFPPGVKEVGGTSAEAFERDLVKTLQDGTSLQSRSIYSTNRVEINNKYYNTTEGAIGDTLGLVFGMEQETKDEFIGAAGNIMYYLSASDLIGMYDDLLGDWGTLSDQKQEEWINLFWGKLDETGALNYLTAAQTEKLRNDFPVLLDLALTFEDGDYYNEHSTYGASGYAVRTMTLLNNAGRLLTNHYPELYLAWARSYDSYYSEETAEYETVKPASISSPTAKAIKSDSEAEESETVLSDTGTNKLKGNQKITLDCEETAGEAIYYTLNDKTNGVDSPEQIYRGGIELKLKNPDRTEYEISEVHAMQYKNTSEKKTYEVVLESTRHKLTVDDTVYYYEEGDSASAVAKAPAGKVFSSWTVKLNGTDITADDDAISANEGKLKKLFGSGFTTEMLYSESIDVRMPVEDTDFADNYSIEIKGNYCEKIEAVDITLAAPVSGESLAANPAVTYKNSVSGESNAIRSEDVSEIQWSYLYSGNKVLASGNAYNSTVYTAEFTVTQDKKNEVFFSDNITASLNGASEVSVLKNESDGSISVTATFPETLKTGDNVLPQSMRTINLKLVDKNINSAIDEINISAVAGQTVTVTAPEVSSEQFACWNSSKSDLQISDTDKEKKTINVTVPTDGGQSGGYALTAEYIPVVQKLTVTLADSRTGEAASPVGGKELPGIKSIKATIDNTYELDPADVRIAWTPAVEDNGFADYSTAYTAVLKLNPRDSQKGIHVLNTTDKSGQTVTGVEYIKGEFAFAEKSKCEINGNEAVLNGAAEGITYTFLETGAYVTELEKIDSVPDVEGLAYGTDERGVKEALPEQVVIHTIDGVEHLAEVTWKSVTLKEGSGLDPKKYEATGTVQLPAGVENGKNLNMTVTANAYVEGAPITETPEATTDSGTYTSDISVVLSCEDSDASIYYTLDGTTPTKASRLYNGPIVIEKGTYAGREVVLKAIAGKDGYRNSYELVRNFKFEIQEDNPGGGSGGTGGGGTSEDSDTTEKDYDKIIQQLEQDMEALEDKIRDGASDADELQAEYEKLKEQYDILVNEKGTDGKLNVVESMICVIKAEITLLKYQVADMGKVSAYNSVTFSWTPDEKIDGYIIGDQAGNKYMIDRTVTERTIEAVTGEENVYIIKPFIIVNGDIVTNNMKTETFTLKPELNKAGKLSAKAGKKKITLKWKKVNGAGGYQIYYKRAGKKAATVKTKALTRTIKNLKSGKKYSLKVRAYTVNSKGNLVYGSYSGTKRIKAK